MRRSVVNSCLGRAVSGDLLQRLRATVGRCLACMDTTCSETFFWTCTVRSRVQTAVATKTGTQGWHQSPVRVADSTSSCPFCRYLSQTKPLQQSCTDMAEIQESVADERSQLKALCMTTSMDMPAMFVAATARRGNPLVRRGVSHATHWLSWSTLLSCRPRTDKPLDLPLRVGLDIVAIETWSAKATCTRTLSSACDEQASGTGSCQVSPPAIPFAS